MKAIPERFFEGARALIRGCALVAGLSVCAMIGITVIDVILRLFKTGITGAYDIVRICGLLAISCGLPYLTAVKGHIAIEFFYQRFSRLGRVVLDSFFRAIVLFLFGFLVYRSVLYGLELKKSGQYMATLHVQVFWMPFVMGFTFLLMMIVTLYHILHPGKEMIKP